MNPYKVLGVSEDATQEEIRAAYLSLVKKYHPDKYTDNPLKELANEKLKEINEAYEMLTKRGTNATASRPSGTGSSSYGNYGNYSGSGSAYSGPNAAEFARVRTYINNNNLADAKALLDTISTRNAEWHYLYGLVYYRMGHLDKAREHFTRAYEQEPGNAAYRYAYTAVNNAGSPFGRYQSGGAQGGDSTSCGFCDVCDLCCAAQTVRCCC